MSKKYPIMVIVVLLLSLTLASCSPGQALGPTFTPTATVTLTPTATLTPTPTFTPAPTFTPTITATPISAFNSKYMKNTAMQVVDVRVDVAGNWVTAIFYLNDVPEELTFQRTGLHENSMEYVWGIYIDTDNDTSTGDSGYNGIGTDYSIIAANIVSQMSESNISQPIEKGVQANVWSMTNNSMSTIAEGKIAVDPEANTITLIGTISGITPDSVFYYKVEDQNPNGAPQTAGGKLVDRVTFIK